MSASHQKHPAVAVLIPCYNEQASVRQVVLSFIDALPDSTIYVYDNFSTDDTASIASAAGAVVRSIRQKGKGNVVRQMFADVDADIYVLVDGDATYDAASVGKLVEKLQAEALDMVVGCRVEAAMGSGDSYRPGHRFGNWLLTSGVRKIFGGSFTDMLSGYRVFSRRFVKSFPALSRGFEIETELTVHALELRMPWGEVPTPYSARPEGSESKLSTFRDGWRILWMICRLYVSEKPLAFYGLCAAGAATLALLLAAPVVVTFIETGLVPRFPTAILAASLMISALVSLACGLILDNVVKGRHEIKRLAYLAIPR
jgi:glycosyltransferase involved in cell wall biosynthesis